MRARRLIERRYGPWFARLGWNNPLSHTLNAKIAARAALHKRFGSGELKARTKAAEEVGVAMAGEQGAQVLEA